MGSLDDYQEKLIQDSIDDIKAILNCDYSIGKLNRALNNLKKYLVILPKYKTYANNQINKIMHFYRFEDKIFYQKYHRMNPKYIEIVLNLSNFK